MSGAPNLGEVVCVGEVAFAPSRVKLLVNDEVGVDLETMPSTSGLMPLSQTFSICRTSSAEKNAVHKMANKHSFLSQPCVPALLTV